MMRAKSTDTMGRDGSTGPAALAETLTVRSTVRASTPLARGIAAVAVVTILASALSSQVPLAAALPVGVLVAAALVDVLDRRLPNRIVAAAALVGTVHAAGTIALGGDVEAAGAALGAIAFAGPLLVMHVITPHSMGFGDVKVACVLGAAVGLIHPLFALVALAAGSLLGAIVGLVTRRATIPFGPALVAGAIAALLLAASPADVVVSPSSPVRTSRS